VTKKFLNLACGDYFIESSQWENIDWAPKNAKIKQANLLKRLPFSNETFDLIYCSHFIEHIPIDSIHNFIIECSRVLKNNGRIRLVLPDLENIAREYISNIDKNHKIFAEFNIVEMIDQCVRKESGGELIKWYKNTQIDPDLMHYVHKRTGYLLVTKINKRSNYLLKIRNLTWRSVYVKAQNEYAKVLVKLLPKWYKENHVLKTATGENHVWMYDFNSLHKILLKAGYKDICKLDAFHSLDTDFPIHPLDVDSLGNSRKGEESMYIEATKY
jgi:predicted SAM-dependent methyltransferase